MFNLLNMPCGVCGLHPAVKPYPLCSACHTALPWFRETRQVQHGQFSLSVLCAYHYDWPVDRMLHTFKFEENLAALPVLMHCLAFLPAPNVEALLPVPVAQQRLAQRGFNQSLLIARAMSRYWNIPVWQNLKRTRHTPHQRQLGRSQRRNNLLDAFQAGTDIPASVMIVDDVLTTGATQLEIARTLYTARPDTNVQGFALMWRAPAFPAPSPLTSTTDS